MVNWRKIFWLLGEQNVEKPILYRSWEKNRMFGDIKEVVWVSKIPISKDREYNIRDCFVNEKIDFHHPNCIDEFVDLLDHFQRQKAP